MTTTEHRRTNPAFIAKALSITIGMLLLVGSIYWQTGTHQFVNFDDNEYVTHNEMVVRGITYESFIWAFTTFHAGNWHPLTWLSHMLDCQLFGLNPGRHHFINVIIHALNSILLWTALWLLTGEIWKSAFVGILFAVHPLHVESVAWVAERKDLLCAFFMMTAMIFYGLYVKKNSLGHYTASLLGFVLGLLSKPMIVTFPFLLLLMDFWPLQRHGSPENHKGVTRSKLYLIKEKLPFFLLSIISCVVTYLAQKSGGAVRSFDLIPFSQRAANALLAYMLYIKKMLYPGAMAVIYPYPQTFPFWQLFTALVLIALLTLFFIVKAGKYPYTFVGWFWFIGMLIPVIGLIQIGPQAMADRYTYIPMTGLFIILAWGIPDLLPAMKLKKFLLISAAAVFISTFLRIAWIQTQYWQNGFTLFQHAVDVTENNGLAHNNLGNVFFRAGYFDLAFKHYSEAVRIWPNDSTAHSNLGAVYVRKGELEKAVGHFEKALELDPSNVDAGKNLENTLAALKK